MTIAEHCKCCYIIATFGEKATANHTLCSYYASVYGCDRIVIVQ